MDDSQIKDIKIPFEINEKWQNIVNLIADLGGVAAALIMKVVPPFTEVFCSSSSVHNPYNVGDKKKLEGLYCEKVVESREKLLITNALKDDKWRENPDIKLGLISYLGFPLQWPNGVIFGTICILDDKENKFNNKIEKLIKQFKELIDSQLEIIYKNKILAEQTEKMENEIKKGDRTLSVLLSNLPGMVYKCKADRTWTMEFVNKACKELTGYKVDQLLQNNEISYGHIIHPDYRHYVWEEINLAIQEDRPFEIEYRITTKNNKEKWVREQGQGVKNEKGKLEYVQGFITDITERKKAKEKLKYMSFHDNLTGLYNRAFLEEEMERLNSARQLPISLVMADLNGLKLINDTYGHCKGDEVLIKTVEILKEIFRKEDIIARYGGDEFVVLLPQTTSQEVQKIIKRIKMQSKEIQVGKREEDKIPLSISFGYAVKKNSSENIYEKLKIAEDRMYKDKFLASKSTKSAIVKTLLRTLQGKSQETEEHGLRINKLASALGEKINLSHSEKEKLSLLAVLHDIGKTIISEKILMKPGKLTRKEWEEIIQHPGTGYRICSATEEFSHIALEILSHHERWDGKGYPRGIKKEEIPLLSRIISIVDAYDVMTYGRSYKKAVSQEEALKELNKCAGNQFDPGLVKIFIEMAENDEL